MKKKEVPKPEPHVSRFVGDMNPEGLFIEVTSPHSSRDRSIQGGVGVWQSQASGKPYPSSSATKQTSTLRQTIQDLCRSHVQTACLPCRPATSEYTALHRIYRDKLDPLFPAVRCYLAQPPDDEITQIVLQQVVSLAAASDPEAVPYLRLQSQDELLSRSEFSARLSCAIRVTLDAGFVTDRYALTRILLVFSLYMQPTCPEEADLPAKAFADATHQMHTLGLHMAADENKEDSQRIRTLFCCMWALDRINSSLYGRALLIHERDIGWDLDAGIAAQDPPFRLFLMIVGLLDRVMDLYRPRNKALQETVVVELPILEQMIIDAGAAKESSAFLGESVHHTSSTTALRPPHNGQRYLHRLASLEILYHSVAILSCRPAAGISASTLPAPAINSRRSLSADRITSIVSREFHDQLSYLPIIAYGVSLSLSVAYQKMRFSNVPMFRSRGKQAFQKNTQLLRSLGDTFWTAKVMAAMAEQVLQEMNKAVASLSSQEPPPGDTARRVDPPSGADKPLETPVSAEPPDPAQEGTSIDPFYVGAVPDVDVFGHLDPTFDLEAVDAALEGNLGFGASSNWFDWQALWE